MSKLKSECLVAIGRFNPPHRGHIELLDSGNLYAQQNNLDFIICPTNTQNCPNNPLNLDEKMLYLSLILPQYKNNLLFIKYPSAFILTESSRPYNSLQVEKFLKDTLGYTKVYIYHSDKDFSPIPTIKGPIRRLDKISATKVRKTVMDNDFNKFIDFYTLKSRSVNDIYSNSDKIEIRKNLAYRKNKSLNDISQDKLTVDGLDKYQLIGNLTIAHLKNLFNILKDRLNCKREPFSVFPTTRRKTQTHTLTQSLVQTLTQTFTPTQQHGQTSRTSSFRQLNPDPLLNQ